MENRRMRLLDADFLREMLPLAIPIVLQNLLMCSFRLVDTLMIGQLGDLSIAAVGLAGQLSFFVELVAFGFASGAAVFIAQYHGAGNRDGILRTYGLTLLFAASMGLVATCAGLFVPRRVLALFTNDAPLIEEGARYMRYACLSYLALTLNQPMAVTLRSTERVRIPMFASILAAAVNAVLNYAFIFGKLGLPAMGVAGAGLATAISSLLIPAVMLLVSIRQKNVLYAPLKKLFAVSGFVRPYLARVLPVLCNEALWAASVLILNMIFGRMGTDNYAALTVFRTVENIAFVGYVGLCNACNILVGKRIGAGDHAGGVAFARRFLLLVPALGACVGLLLILSRGAILSLFDVSDTARSTAMQLIVIYGLEISLRNIPYVGVVGIFRAGGDARFGLVMDTLIQYGLMLPTVLLAGLVFRLPFVLTYLIMLLMEDVTKCVAVLLHFRRMKWIKPVAGPPDESGAI